MIQIKGAVLLPPMLPAMGFDPRQLWQLSILEVVGIATLVLSAVVIAGLVYSIW